MKLIAKSLFGTEEIVAQELTELGIKDPQIARRAVVFEGNKEDLYRINLHSRLALRILAPFHAFKASNENQLYDKIYQFKWPSILSNDKTFAIDVSANSNIFTHSHYVALKIKDAIVDQFRNDTGQRPSIDIKNPHIRLNVHIENDQFSLSTDSSGSSLHQRGYRPLGTTAPLNEILACSLLKFAGWKPEIPLFDPMCGSGTILIEAATMARKIPPGIHRQYFGFMGWKNYDESLWKKVRQEGVEKIIEADTQIFGSDQASAAINLSKMGARTADVIGNIRLQKCPFSEAKRHFEEGLIITNPPYGERIIPEDIEDLYKEYGDFLKQQYTGSDAWIFSGNIDALKHVGLSAKKKIDLFNGGLKAKYVHYPLYKGSKKNKD